MKIASIHSFALATALAVGLAACPSRSHAQSIVNGGFEDPAEATNSLTEITATGIPGWTGDSIGGATHEYLINGNIEDLQGRYYGTTPYGQQYLGLNAIANRSFRSIESQTDSGFVAGQEYALTVYIADLDGATDPNVSVVATDGTDGTGTILSQQTFEAPVSTGPYGQGTIDFVPETLDFTAMSSNVTFSIGNQSKTGTMGIDNVSLAAVPEPSTTAAALLGVAALAGVTIRRRARLA